MYTIFLGDLYYHTQLCWLSLVWVCLPVSSVIFTWAIRMLIDHSCTQYKIQNYAITKEIHKHMGVFVLLYSDENFYFFY